MSKVSCVEYIWLDGVTPTQALRSKTRIISYSDDLRVDDLPEWSFDGSSTQQAVGHDSDCLLDPVCLVPDPIRGSGNYLAMCEVLTPAHSAHESNKRAALRQAMEKGGYAQDPYIGFEQEYTMFCKGRPYGWPEGGYPAPQGPFYCGVGSENVYGRDLVEEHMNASNMAGLALFGTNAEVMPGQWEFQVGYRGITSEKADPVTIADHLWLGRYLLQRLGEKYHIKISFHNKPMKGDWNGAGMHTNFSTQPMRDSSGGTAAIEKAIQALEKVHEEHVAAYGAGLEERLTGAHETCSIHEFKSGVSDRGASIRIPVSTHENGFGYIEDRRPGANADPYVVAEKLVSTICC